MNLIDLAQPPALVTTPLEVDPNLAPKFIQTLCRRTRNNPLLFIEANNSVLNLVPLLGQQLFAGSVPEVLLGKRLLTINPLLLTDTLSSTQSEALLAELIAESLSSKAIAFIANLDFGNYINSAAGTLKVAMVRNGLQIIGIVSEDTYRRRIEPDASLRIRFNLITPSINGNK
jgi:ATP-dependent Clp protease ATP-binding subunit ClpC